MEALLCGMETQSDDGANYLENTRIHVHCARPLRTKVVHDLNIAICLLQWSWQSNAKVPRSDSETRVVVSCERVTECAHLASFCRPGLELGQTAKRQLVQHGSMFDPPAPCVVLGSLRDSIPPRHACHPEHLVGRSPPYSLGSGCANTRLGMASKSVRLDFRVCDPPRSLIPQANSPERRADCPFALPLSFYQRVPVITKLHNWRP